MIELLKVQQEQDLFNHKAYTNIQTFLSFRGCSNIAIQLIYCIHDLKPTLEFYIIRNHEKESVILRSAVGVNTLSL